MSDSHPLVCHGPLRACQITRTRNICKDIHMANWIGHMRLIFQIEHSANGGRKDKADGLHALSNQAIDT